MKQVPELLQEIMPYILGVAFWIIAAKWKSLTWGMTRRQCLRQGVLIFLLVWSIYTGLYIFLYTLTRFANI